MKIFTNLAIAINQMTTVSYHLTHQTILDYDWSLCPLPVSQADRHLITHQLLGTGSQPAQVFNSYEDLESTIINLLKGLKC